MRLAEERASLAEAHAARLRAHLAAAKAHLTTKEELDELGEKHDALVDENYDLQVQIISLQERLKRAERSSSSAGEAGVWCACRRAGRPRGRVRGARERREGARPCVRQAPFGVFGGVRWRDGRSGCGQVAARCAAGSCGVRACEKNRRQKLVMDRTIAIHENK